MRSNYEDAGTGRGRHEIQIPSDTDSGVESSDDDINFMKKKAKDNESQIYGVFGEGSDADEDNYGGAGLGRGRGRGAGRKGSSSGSRVRGPIQWKKQENERDALQTMFVKSSSQAKTPSNNTEDVSNGNNKKEHKDGDSKNEVETADDVHAAKEMKEANDKFNNLLRRGAKRKRDAKDPNRDTDRSMGVSNGLGYNDSMNTDSKGRSRSYGLGFSSEQGGTGLGFKAASSEPTPTNNDNFDQEMGMDSSTPGLGLSSFFSNSSKMAKFTGESQETTKKTFHPPIKRDPNCGQWEKHTKGIGMKLLSKMGYKGSGGLGAKRLKKTVSEVKDEVTGETVKKETMELKERKGISRPVEVVVRPGGLGLGFGKFKEATKLKANQRIEAEVRGVDWKKKEAEEQEKKRQEEKKRMEQELGMKSSALPSTDSLLTASNWRKGSKKRSLKKKTNVKVVSYQEIIGGAGGAGTNTNGADNEAKKELVIDMRGPSMTNISTESEKNDGEILLGEELLHNVTFLLNTYENKLHSNSHFVRSARSKANSLKSEVDNMEQQRTRIGERKGKLEKILSLIENLEKYQGKGQKFDIGDDNEVDRIKGVLECLCTTFTDEEKNSLQFYTAFIPSLLGPLMSQALKSWHPLSSSPSKTRSFIYKIFELCSKASAPGDFNSQVILLKIIFQSHLLPTIKRALQSKWDPVHDVESGLTLYESILAGVELVPIERQDEIEDETTVLGSVGLHTEEEYLTVLVRDSIMFDIIYPKLSRTLSDYKAGGSGDRLDMWILPWLMHLDYRSMLDNMLPDIKRKIRSIVTKSSRITSTADDELFFRHVGEIILKPWVSVLNTRSMHAISSECLGPRFGKYLSKTKYVKKFADQDITRLNKLFAYYTDGMLSESLFLSLIEGEVLPSLANLLHKEIQCGNVDAIHAAKLYHDWKVFLFQSRKCLKGIKAPRRVLGEDAMVCNILYGLLLAIHATNINDKDKFEDLEPPGILTINYRVVQSRRAKEQRLKEEEEALGRQVDSIDKMSRMHVASRNRDGVTFREVVEDFANLNNIPFHPKANSVREGKKIFMFGNAQVYLDSSVVFVNRKGLWTPVALKGLIELC